MQHLSPRQARLNARANQTIPTTSGMSLGYAQANIVIVPKEYALDFYRFCTLHPKACPLLYVSEAGETSAAPLGEDIDIRTDLHGYHIIRNGNAELETSSITDYWQDDFVTFYIGCSFSFEESLISHGIDMPHITAGQNVPMYLTDRELTPAGVFSGHLVVSMRALASRDVVKAVQITSSMHRVHGAPVHIGDPTQIGIHNLEAPEFGDPPALEDGMLPTFWACGVTTQQAIHNSKIPIAITHAPGKMLVTDIVNADLHFS